MLATEGVTDMLRRLTCHFYWCFDPAQHILPLEQAWAVACLKAIHHCSVEQSRGIPFSVNENEMMFFIRLAFYMAPDQAYLMFHCAAKYPFELDMQALPSSDRIWMAHMFTYRLHESNNDSCHLFD